MTLSFKDRLSISLATNTAAGLFKVWFKTCPVRIIRPEIFKDWAYTDRQVIAVTWHRSAIFFVNFFGPIRPMILFSRSKDGEYLACFAQKFGVQPVRGSSSRGGAEALREMIDHLKNGGKACATVLDGPRGPARIAKKGMILLAMETGVPIIPIIWSAPRVWTFKKSWDKTMIPMPFSPITINCSDPIYVPQKLDPAGLEVYRQKVEEILNRLTDEVDQICGYRPPADRRP
ncbi:MAG: lysophospholipid acyltransferase family protein [Deltaproteobacteria bacterium]|nr:lysophospholipid acyltransferase family protein [Deltaproteobacteria bacterium]